MIDKDSLCAKCGHAAVCSKRERLERSLHEIHDGEFLNETQSIKPEKERHPDETAFYYALDLKGGFSKCPDYIEQE